MTAIEPLIPGIYARSERLVQTTRDFDRDRVDRTTLKRDQRRDTEALIGLQVTEGYRTVSPGLLTWQDHFRPFERLIPELSANTLTRFIDTNTFYRRPDLEGEPTLDTAELDTVVETHVPNTGAIGGLLTLPSPTAWVTAADDDDNTYPEPEIAHQIASSVYPPVVEAAIERGVETIVLTDPWFGTHPDATPLLGAIDDFVEAIPESQQVHLQLPFQDSGDVLAAVGDTLIDGALVDLTETDRQRLAALPSSQTVGLGLVDARSSLIEREDLLVSAIESASEHVAGDEVLVTPTGDLQHVPEPIARQKVRLLSSVATTARLAAAAPGGEPA